MWTWPEVSKQGWNPILFLGHSPTNDVLAGHWHGFLAGQKTHSPNPVWEVITQNANGKAWIVITSSLFAFLGQEHPNKMSDPGSDPWIASRTCSNIWISGTPMRCSFNMFFIFPTLLKGTKSALNSFCSKLPESPFVYKIAFWEIMKPKFPLIKLLH